MMHDPLPDHARFLGFGIDQMDGTGPSLTLPPPAGSGPQPCLQRLTALYSTGQEHDQYGRVQTFCRVQSGSFGLPRTCPGRLGTRMPAPLRRS